MKNDDLRPKFHQKVSTIIESLGRNGEGIGYWQGYPLFVDRALPGELIEGRLAEQNHKYSRMDSFSIENPSSFRVKPICPIFNLCGGCQLMHMEYQKQLEFKRQQVIEALQKIGKMVDVEVLPCQPAPSPLAYRNKIQLPVSEKDQKMEIGLYARHSHEIVEMDKCYVHCELGERVFHLVKSLLKQSQVVPYNSGTGEGELKHLLIKTAIHTQEVLVVFITKGMASPSLLNIAQEIYALCPEVKGIVHNINNTLGNVVLGKQFHTLCGNGYIKEKICGKIFTVSPASFFQVNIAQAECLYRKALELASLSLEDSVLDAYCGVGTLSLLIASQVKQVIGVECVPEAIENAKENALANGISNTQFICEQAEVLIKELKNLDVVFLNPPRKGCALSFLDSLCQLRPKKIVYISCDPSSLARDLTYLRTKGYKIDSIHPFDMFPQTAHVESIAKLSI